MSLQATSSVFIAQFIVERPKLHWTLFDLNLSDVLGSP